MNRTFEFTGSADIQKPTSASENASSSTLTTMDIDDESTVEFNDSLGASLDLNRHSSCDPIPKTNHVRSSFNGNESTDSFMLEDSFACGESFSCDDGVGVFPQSPPRKTFRPRLDLTTVIDFEEDEESESLPEIKEGDFDEEDDSDKDGEDEDDEDGNEFSVGRNCCSIHELERRAEVLSLSVHGSERSHIPLESRGF